MGSTSQGEYMSLNYQKYVIMRVALAAVLLIGLIDVHAAKAETVGFGWAQRLGGRNLDYETAIPYNQI